MTNPPPKLNVLVFAASLRLNRTAVPVPLLAPRASRHPVHLPPHRPADTSGTVQPPSAQPVTLELLPRFWLFLDELFYLIAAYDFGHWGDPGVPHPNFLYYAPMTSALNAHATWSQVKQPDVGVPIG